MDAWDFFIIPMAREFGVSIAMAREMFEKK
jgi:hypothetical protein